MSASYRSEDGSPVAAATERGLWPLVGREAELEYVAGVLGRGGRGVVLAGDAGVGRTRLAHEVAAAATERRWVTETVLATTAAATIPFGAMAHLLPVPAPAAGDLLSMHQAITGHLRTRAGGASLVVIVDDAHLLDPGSAALVLQLALSATAFVVATVRTGRPAPDPITALWKEGLVPRLEVQPLSEAEVGRLLEAALGGEIERATQRWLFEATQGNPLLLRELVGDALAAGVVARHGAAWRWTGEVPSGLRLDELIEARLGPLTRAERHVLELLAVAGPLGTGLLQGLTEHEALAEVEARGLVEVERRGLRIEINLSQPLYAGALRASMPEASWRAASAALATAVESFGTRRHEDLLPLVTWRLDAGGSAPPELLTEAAALANERLDHPLAERLAGEALRAGAGLPAALALADGYHRQGRFAEAEAVLATWEGAAGGDGLAYLVQRAGALHTGLARTDEANALLDRAAAAPASRAQGDLAQVIKAELLASDARFDAALDLSTAVLADPLVDEAVRLRAVGPAGFSLAMLGRPREARALVDGNLGAALRRQKDLPEALNRWLGAPLLATLFVEGRYDEADALLLPSYELAISRGDDTARSGSAVGLGRVAVARGRGRHARRWLTEAEGVLRERDVNGLLPLCLAMLAQANARVGDVDDARRFLEEAAAAARPGKTWWRMDVALAEVWVAAGSGELLRAQELALGAAAASASAPSRQAILLHEALRVGAAPATVASRLAAIAASSRSALFEAYAAHARARSDRRPSDLEAVARQVQGMGATLLAAEVLAEAAAAHRLAGAAEAARRCAHRSHDLASLCEGARTPALSINAAPVAVLTRREGEVVTLAARGLSNAEIAGHLVLSVRTVESHLLHAFAKLGVRTREELPGQL